MASILPRRDSRSLPKTSGGCSNPPYNHWPVNRAAARPAASSTMGSVRRLAASVLALGILATCGCSIFHRSTGSAVCAESHGLEVVSLAIYPDPLPDTRRLDEWRLRVRSDTPR